MSRAFALPLEALQQFSGPCTVIEEPLWKMGTLVPTTIC